MSVKSMLCLLALLSCFTLLFIAVFFFGLSDERPRIYDIYDRTDRHFEILNRSSGGFVVDYVIDTKCNYTNEYRLKPQNERNKLKAVWIITSYAGDVSKRSALRYAYTAQELEQLGIRRIFLLGLLNEKAQKETGISQAAIKNEAQSFQDIIQGNFVEAYKNLTYKHLMGLRWAVDKCSSSYSYIMKMDDDIIVNLYEVMELLKDKTSSNVNENFLMGYVMEHLTPIRNSASKWFVTGEEFPGKVYPTFLSGWFYVTDMMTALKLIYQSRYHSQYFYIDDLFVTGILREEAGIDEFIYMNEYFTTDYRFLECCLKYEGIQPKYKCDFIVGPDGGKKSLLLEIKKYSENCYKNHCLSRPKEFHLKHKCILEYKHVNPGTGNVQVESFF